MQRRFKSALNRFKLNNYSQSLIIIFALIQITLLGVLDYLTGFELSFSVFYLIPVAMTAWYLEKNMALLVSVISAATLQFSNQLAGEQFFDWFVPVWNTTTRLACFVFVAILITKLKKSLSQEAALARTDFLTGAANSRAFYETAQMEINRCRRYRRPFTLAFFDVDDFKGINDTLGHQAGNNLLVRIVETVWRDLRASDTIARIGGDEFALLFLETDREQARIVANKMRGKLQQEMDSQGWKVTFSFGVLTCAAAPASLDEVIKAADDLMYEVKRNGKNSIKYKELKSSSPVQPDPPKEACFDFAFNLISPPKNPTNSIFYHSQS